jgi:hypothetical protein
MVIFTAWSDLNLIWLIFFCGCVEWADQWVCEACKSSQNPCFLPKGSILSWDWESQLQCGRLRRWLRPKRLWCLREWSKLMAWYVFRSHARDRFRFGEFAPVFVLGGGGCETGVLRVILWAGFLVVYANGVLW